MKKFFEAPMAEVVKFAVEDVVTVSGGMGCENQTPEEEI